MTSLAKWGNSQIRVISSCLHLITISLWSQVWQFSEGVLFSMSHCLQGDGGRTFWRHCCSRVLLWSWRITLYSADPWSKFNPFVSLSKQEYYMLIELQIYIIDPLSLWTIVTPMGWFIATWRWVFYHLLLSCQLSISILERHRKRWSRTPSVIAHC